MQDHENYRYTTVRMPEALEVQLGEIAARNRRSRTAEIVMRLEASIEKDLAEQAEQEKTPAAANG